MTVKPAGFISAFLLIGMIVSDVSFSQSNGKRDILGSFRDWDAILIERDNGERICHVISIPKDTQPEGANRGDIYITVTHRPRRKVRDEVHIVVGYPLRTGSEVTASIGSRRFAMFTEGRGAWHYSQEDDSRMVTAMKAGNALVIRGTSARGTDTTDRYSLIGFTAAYNAITSACR